MLHVHSPLAATIFDDRTAIGFSLSFFPRQHSSSDSEALHISCFHASTYSECGVRHASGLGCRRHTFKRVSSTLEVTNESQKLRTSFVCGTSRLSEHTPPDISAVAPGGSSQVGYFFHGRPPNPVQVPALRRTDVYDQNSLAHYQPRRRNGGQASHTLTRFWSHLLTSPACRYNFVTSSSATRILAISIKQPYPDSPGVSLLLKLS